MSCLYLGDCLNILSTLPENSVDSIVTDPPYGLSFMNKTWDYDVPSVEIWRECLRVLKPGGHLLAFGGTRTYHRLVVAIEDAGFEIRDQIQWIQGQGFPKNLDIKKAAIKEGIACDCESKTKHTVQAVSGSDVSTTVPASETGMVLQSSLSEQSTPTYRNQDSSRVDDGREQPRMERGQLHRTGEGLQNDSYASAPQGTNQRVCTGTHSDSGTDAGQTANRDGRSTPPESRQTRQPTGESEGLRESHGTLDGASLPRCPSCQKAQFPEGLGSALKPAFEPVVVASKPSSNPICLARKPLSESTIAKNVLKHGTGGLNIDSSRIETTDNLNGGRYSDNKQGDDGNSYGKGINLRSKDDYVQPEGRFPSNVILDEDAAKVLDEQTGDLGKSQGGSRGGSRSMGFGMAPQPDFKPGFGDSGGASRFFYVPKVSSKERGDSTHPTMKPIKLMEYLIKLVTPEGGKVLDPFMGSGTTGLAAAHLGHDFVGIERHHDYFKIALQRIGNRVEIRACR